MRPDRLLVWGEASRRHAMEYHGFTPDQVTVTGPPHFDCYHEPRVKPAESIVLVAGTTVNYWADELTMVGMLTRHFDHIVHRPHPRRGGDWSWAAMLALRSQLDAAICVVAAFSTVVIETALMGKPSMLIGFGQSAHGPAMAEYHMNLEHMAEVTSWSGVEFCKNEEELVGSIRAALNGAFTNRADDLRRRAQEVARSDGHAQERILEALEWMKP